MVIILYGLVTETQTRSIVRNNILSDTFSSRAKQHRRTTTNTMSKTTKNNKNKLNKKRYEPKTPVNNTYNTRSNQNHYRQQSVKKVEFLSKDFETKKRDRSTVMSELMCLNNTATHHRFAGFSTKPACQQGARLATSTRSFFLIQSIV